MFFDYNILLVTDGRSLVSIMACVYPLCRSFAMLAASSLTGLAAARSSYDVDNVSSSAVIILRW